MADFTRHALEENLNPVFQDEPIPKMTILNINITRFTKEIDEMEDYHHHCSDDEDCKKFPYLFQATCADDNSIEFSGSGGGFTDDGTEPVSSGSMPTPRVQIMTLSTHSKPSFPPMVINTNGTASPTTQSDEPITTDTSINDGNVTSNTDIIFTPITSNQNSGTSILHLKTHHLLFPLMLGILYIV